MKFSNKFNTQIQVFCFSSLRTSKKRFDPLNMQSTNFTSKLHSYFLIFALLIHFSNINFSSRILWKYPEIVDCLMALNMRDIYKSRTLKTDAKNKED